MSTLNRADNSARNDAPATDETAGHTGGAHRAARTAGATARAAATFATVAATLLGAAGVAQAVPNQPGVTGPSDGQPGVTPPPAAPQVAPAPVQTQEIPIAPNRPRPKQQEQPAVVSPAQDSGTQPADETPAPAPVVVDPHVIRIGNQTVVSPDFIPTDIDHNVQIAADTAEWNLAAAFDALGYSRDDSDRAAAAALGGGTIGALAGTAVAQPLFVVGGCGAGVVIGAVIGGVAAGAATAGAMAPLGAVGGGIIGCAIGGFVAGLPAAAVGALAGGLGGAALGGALGAGNGQHPAAAPIDEAASVSEDVAPQPDPALSAPVESVAQQVADSGPVGEQAVTSLRGALDAMPMFDPAQLGAAADVANGAVSVLQGMLR